MTCNVMDFERVCGYVLRCVDTVHGVKFKPKTVYIYIYILYVHAHFFGEKVKRVTLITDCVLVFVFVFMCVFCAC
jgi:hypothetical protein